MQELENLFTRLVHVRCVFDELILTEPVRQFGHHLGHAEEGIEGAFQGVGNDGEELILDGGLVFEPVDQRRLVLHEFGELDRSLFHVFADDGIGLAVRY